jgi:tyrosinase
MLAIAKWYDKPYQATYLAAARAFRLPYWDYFRPRDVDARFPGIKLEGNRTRFEYDFRMPDILNVREVMVRVPPYDNLELRGNPLYTFRFTNKLNLDKDWVKAKLTVSTPHVVS